MPLFSVIIPTYNRGSLITATLDSVFAQEFRDFDVIVVDDGSTDDTIQRLEPYRDRIKFLQQQNRGPGAARNLGVQHSDSDYIAFLDSDDLWFPWTLGTYADVIRTKNAPTLLAGTLVYFTDPMELNVVAKEPVSLEVHPDYLAAGRSSRYCGTCQMVVKRKPLLVSGGFTEEKVNAEDHDLTIRLGTSPGFIFFTQPGMIAYRQHPAAVTRDLTKTVTGIQHMMTMERQGKYPGGDERRRDRWRILSQHARPLSMALLGQREFRQAWRIYKQTFPWNVSLGRFRYLTGFFVAAAKHAIFL